MYSHKEFVTTGLEPKPHHEIKAISRPYPQFFRIVLRSADRDSGSTKINAQFSGVAMPERFSAPAVLIVNSFTLENADSSALVNNALELHLGGIVHPRSFDSANKTATDLLCVVNGYSYINQNPAADSVGLPITDPNQFQNAHLNVYFKNTGGSALSDFTGDWCLILDIISYDNSMAY